jgi:hypothetical protein
LEQAIFDSETVANVFISKNGPVQSAHDLMHVDQDSPGVFGTERNRLDVRVNLRPLLRPVSSDLLMTANNARVSEAFAARRNSNWVVRSAS